MIRTKTGIAIFSSIFISSLLLAGCGKSDDFGEWSAVQEISTGSGNRQPATALNSTHRVAIWEQISYSNALDTADHSPHTGATNSDQPDQLKHTHYIKSARTSVWVATGEVTTDDDNQKVTVWDTPVKLATGISRNIEQLAIADDSGRRIWGENLGLTEFTGSQVAMDKNNNGLAVWVMQNSSGINEIKSARFDGDSWSGITTISNSTNSVRKPQLAMEPNGNAIAIWEQMDQNCLCFTLVARLYKPGSGGWESSAGDPVITLVSSDSTDTTYGKPATVSNARVVYSASGVGMVAWNQLETDATTSALPSTGNRAIYAHPLLASGWTGTPVAVSNTSVLAEDLALAINNIGQAVLAWEEWDSISAPTRREVNVSTYNSGSWSAASPAHPNQTTLDTHEVTATITDSGDAYVAWTAHDNAGGLNNKWNNASSQLWLATDKSGSWIESLTQNNSRLAIHTPRLLNMNDPLIMLSWREWNDPTVQSSYVVYGQAIDTGSNSSETRRLGAASNDEKGSLSMAASGSSLNLVWSEGENQIQSVDYTR